MIEREFIIQKTKEFYIKKYIENKLKSVGVSRIRLKKIPLGEKIIIHTNRPSLIVGSKGSNIKELTKALKNDFRLENPQIEIAEVKDIFLDANIVAQRIASSLERFGSARFKSVGHKVMENVLNSGALGVELIISGKIPGARAKNWRFYQGYLKKCGDVAVSGVRKAQCKALLKSGIIGIKVAIMPPDLVLPDSIEILDELTQVVEEVADDTKKSKKKTTRKRAKKKTDTESVESKSKESSEESPASQEESATETEEAPKEAPAEDDKPKEEPKEEPAAETEESKEAAESKETEASPEAPEFKEEPVSKDESSEAGNESKDTKDSESSEIKESENTNNDSENQKEESQ